MPSLNALGEFRDSFSNIADERNILASRNIPPDKLALPDTEAVPFDSGQSAPPAGDAQFDALFGDETSASPGVGDFDFSAFLDNIPGDVSPPPMDDILPVSDIPAATNGNGGDYSVPEGLLSGLSDEIESAPTDKNGALPDFDFGSETFDNGSDADGGLSGFDLGGESFDSGSDADTGLPDFDLGGESFDSGSDADTGLPDFDLGGESFDTGSDADTGLPDFDLGGMDTSAAESASFEAPEQTLDLGGERQDGSFSTGDDQETFEVESAGIDSEITDTGEEIFNIGGDESGELPSDGFQSDGLADFDLGGESFDSGTTDDFSGLDTGFDLGTADTGTGEMPDAGTGADFDTGSIELDGSFDTQPIDSGDFGGDELAEGAADSGEFGETDFNLSGLDDILNKTKTDTTVKPPPKRGFFSRKPKVEEEPEHDQVGEIQLTQNDLDNLLKTLSSYPLNLRVVCEELIAEQVLKPHHLSKLIRYLINHAPVKETAALAQEITGKEIIIPKSFQKSTGAELEAEQASFAYIFVHNFLPVLRLFAMIAALGASVIYLGYKFIYIPVKAESLYKRGYERIFDGQYQRANGLFDEAFILHPKKPWFYKYAEAFIKERRYMLAEEKYEELLRNYPRDKKGVLDYASLETYYLMNYDKANRILQNELLDYAPNDFEGLVASGDNYMAWADSDPSRYGDKYEDARFAYARILEKYGWTEPIVERMMMYFIRTDNLKEVLPLKAWFDSSRKRQLSAPTLAELGGYYLDKQLEDVKGVPNPYVESIEGVRAMLLEAVRLELTLPEPHYHLARYYNNLGNVYEERLTLQNAIRAFDMAKEESVRRRLYRVDTHYRYANLLVNNREFFPAEEQLVRGIELYEDFLSRNLVSSSPQLGKLYAAKGDIEYFAKSGDMQSAIRDYRRAEQNGWSPPEIQYRMGAAYYQLEDWKNSLDYLFKASASLPLNRKLLYALGNVTYKRGDYFAAQGYYNRLLDILENQRARLPVLLPNDRPDFLEVGERLMMARNNAGVVYEALADQTGNRDYRSRALVLYAESARAWDAITRNPISMERMRLTDDLGAPGVNLAFLNANNALHANNAQRPGEGYKPEPFPRIDKDVLEPSLWEELSPLGGGLKGEPALSVRH
ncbi:MAG: tetratricopeptide repeat protein [Treponema sp.]|nr:tetratricopeptide repeat protein [Treponema sp.]